MKVEVLNRSIITGSERGEMIRTYGHYVRSCLGVITLVSTPKGSHYGPQQWTQQVGMVFFQPEDLPEAPAQSHVPLSRESNPLCIAGT